MDQSRERKRCIIIGTNNTANMSVSVGRYQMDRDVKMHVECLQVTPVAAHHIRKVEPSSLEPHARMSSGNGPVYREHSRTTTGSRWERYITVRGERPYDTRNSASNHVRCLVKHGQNQMQQTNLQPTCSPEPYRIAETDRRPDLSCSQCLRGS